MTLSIGTGKTMRASMCGLVLLACLAACNRKGTCMRSTSPELGDACVINTTKGACKQGKFVKETPAQALLRCKAAGYEHIGNPADLQGLDKGKIVVLYRGGTSYK